MQSQNPVTMKEVAERAGVSMMTVSLALRGNPAASRISEETRQRVLEAAKALRYRPNARGRALRSGHTNIIGLYAGYGYVNVRLPFFTELVSGLQEGCELYKKDLLLHGTFHGNTTEDIYTELADGRIDGLIAHMPSENALAERLADSRLPVIAVADPLPGIPAVLVDDVMGARLLAQYLAGRGYRRCLYLRGELPAASTYRRRLAFLQTASELGLEVEEFQESSNLGQWEADLQGQLDKHSERPVLLVCWNDNAAYGALAYCQRKGIRVPEEVAVVGFDGCPTPYDAVWSLTTIRAPWAAVARTAMDLLNALLEGQSVPPETMLAVELVAGHTA